MSAPPLPDASIPSDSFEAIRERLRALLTTGPVDAQETLDSLADQIMAPRDERFGGWNDLHPASSPLYTGGGNMFYELLALAKAWRDPDSPHYHDAMVAERFNLGWQCVRRFVYPGCPFPGNWWNWQVGSPECISQMLLVAPQLFTQETRQHAVATLRYLVDQIPLEHPGANGMSSAMTFFRYGVLTDDADYVDLATRYVDRVSAITDHQGIMPDFSYAFHGRGVNLAYGQEHFALLAQFASALDVSPSA